MNIPAALGMIAYLASLPALFVAWAAIEIKIHPDKYR
jgi:hypothetical protein